MPTVKVKRIPQKAVTSRSVNDEVDEMLAKFCYYFPQYTFAEAQRLPYKRLVHMLEVAQKEYGRFMYDMTRASIASVSEKAQKKTLEYFEKLAKGER